MKRTSATTEAPASLYPESGGSHSVSGALYVSYLSGAGSGSYTLMKLTAALLSGHGIYPDIPKPRVLQSDGRNAHHRDEARYRRIYFWVTTPVTMAPNSLSGTGSLTVNGTENVGLRRHPRQFYPERRHAFRFWFGHPGYSAGASGNYSLTGTGTLANTGQQR